MQDAGEAARPRRLQLVRARGEGEQRLLHDRHHGDEVAMPGELVEVEDLEVRAPVGQRPRARAARPDVQRHALGLVVAARDRAGDPRVDAGPRTIEHEPGVAVRAPPRPPPVPQPASKIATSTAEKWRAGALLVDDRRTMAAAALTTREEEVIEERGSGRLCGRVPRHLHARLLHLHDRHHQLARRVGLHRLGRHRPGALPAS